ncbi:MAG: UDP-N-acetylmuramoyl-L-alanyl-D-glutamate--2,6-diaminopimelate ligase [Paracoccaceae bacterium]|jgi:UDP-N-acetylmuramoyl-L-alanyl-D-glutamate--2,6-diaminopimelate ligase
MKTLSELGLTAKNRKSVQITGLSVDSRRIEKGNLFAALPGMQLHGAQYVEVALSLEAAAILTDAAGAHMIQADVEAAGAALIVAQDPRAALAMAAALWYGAQPKTMSAVTGTNGKTSVASFTRQIWSALGYEAINIGTTGVEGAFSAPSPHTTPEPITLHQMLARAAELHVTHAVMEASSHGLDQARLDGVKLRAAAFTNFTHDHLDYHHSFDEYFAAKAGLFNRVLPDDGTAVINMDDTRGADIAAISGARGQRIIRVGRAEGNDLRLLAQRYDAAGQEVRLQWGSRLYQVYIPLIGGFQAENAALAAGLAIGSGAPVGEVLTALPRLSGVRGRMQRAATRASGALVFVDYAHTPDALETALKALRPHVMGRIILVFGAGGDRDRNKRSLMGAAAASYADLVFVTDDNPRSEPPASIRAAIMAHCPDATEVGDRAEAILRGVDALGAGDALLIAGKGHETGQAIGGDIYPFDDVEQASISVAALDGMI